MNAWGESWGGSWGASWGSASSQVSQVSGGWFPIQPRRTKEDIQRQRIALGILPPEKEERVEEAVAVIASKAKEVDQQRAEDLFISTYLSVYPKLERQRLLDELAYQAYLMEERDFAIFLSTL